MTDLHPLLSFLESSPQQLLMSLIQENKRLFLSIIAEHASEGASSSATFFNSQLPRLDPRKSLLGVSKAKLKVINGDTFVVAREMMDVEGKESVGKTAVLNLASDEYPGGGWESGSCAQEECLCYSSTLFHTLSQPSIFQNYPWPNTGPGSAAGIFSEGVVVFREPLIRAETLSQNTNAESTVCPILPPPSRKVLSVISVAAPRYPVVTQDGSDFRDAAVKEDFKEKVRLVLRMAGIHDKRYLVLGAMGCGAYGCPPRTVAKLIRGVILEKEFVGWFTRIIFAVYSSSESVRLGGSNFEVFRDVLEGVEV
ncbi:hypothetical protein BDP27DRAFT_1317011 [Rhodocollybia butyracea]|uniref:Microbial-type PARG catalytic domain-containing protein n=1 Tax=Rhodocollybia butyracea TaxID=206335 RepID=A0A9P5Q483_9AGAR|nr:hypothetical protein BDP27DRAFT_1317011 [Rhodocollybia butyracea]